MKYALNSLVLIAGLGLSSSAISDANSAGQATLGYGHSDNLAKTREDTVGGDFVNAGVRLTGNFDTSARNAVGYHMSLNLRHHLDEIHADNFDQTTVGLEVSNHYEIAPSHLIGALAHFTYLSGRTTDTEVGSTSGRRNEYTEPGVSLLYDTSLPLGARTLDLGTKLSFLQRDYRSLANDENGNLFEDDYHSLGLALSVTYKFTDRLTYRMDPEVQDQRFKYRRSRYSEGTLDNNERNPLQNLRVWSWGHRLTYDAAFFSVSGGGALVLQDDREFGALDYQGQKAFASFELPFSNFLILKPSFQTAVHRYQSFVAEVLDDPKSTEKRVDRILSYQVPLEVKLSSIAAYASYQSQKLTTNYPQDGYKDTTYEFGVQYAF